MAARNTHVRVKSFLLSFQQEVLQNHGLGFSVGVVLEPQILEIKLKLSINQIDRQDLASKTEGDA